MDRLACRFTIGLVDIGIGGGCGFYRGQRADEYGKPDGETEPPALPPLYAEYSKSG